MSERFECLYAIKEHLYAPNSPVVIMAGALLKDTLTNTIVVQLKFQSIAKKVIKAIKVSINAFDISGTELLCIQDYQYLDLSIRNGGAFGADKAIIIPENTSRFFSIKKIVVVFSDNSSWEGSETDFSALPTTKKLQDVLNKDLIEQYKIATTPQANYVPQNIEALWTCSCGQINSDKYCIKCNCNKDKVFSSFNIPKLTTDAEIRLRNEQQTREKFNKVRKRRKRILICFICAVLIIIFGGVVCNNLVFPLIKYNEAVLLKNNKEYDLAIAKFNELDGFKDSETLIKDCEYNIALELLLDGQYISSLESFISLDGYKDSTERADSILMKWHPVVRNFWEFYTTGDETSSFGTNYVSVGASKLYKEDYYIGNVKARVTYDPNKNIAYWYNNTSNLEEYKNVLKTLTCELGNPSDTMGNEASWRGFVYLSYNNGSLMVLVKNYK